MPQRRSPFVQRNCFLVYGKPLSYKQKRRKIILFMIVQLRLWLQHSAYPQMAFDSLCNSFSQSLDCLALIFYQAVRIEIQSRSHRTMSQQYPDRFHIYPQFQHARCKAMPQRAKMHIVDSVVLRQHLKSSLDRSQFFRAILIAKNVTTLPGSFIHISRQIHIEIGEREPCALN